SVVLVALESTAARYLGLYGAAPDVMPHLSALARTAVVFDNAYAVYPESIKGLFSVLCSTYPAFDVAAGEYAATTCPSLAADTALGSLVRGLDARGRLRNTLWIVYGDHGEAFGQHDGNVGHTFQLYDENVRVPLVIAAPGLIREQIRVQRVASLIDTTATTLDLLGAGRPIVSQGRSMLDPDARMALFFADYSRGLMGLRDGPRKFVYELDSERAKLFDVAADPDERMNIAERHAALAREYERLLREWSAEQKHEFRFAASARRILTSP